MTYDARVVAMFARVSDFSKLFLDPPSKENPYEDIELESRCLGNKCPLPVSPTSSIPDTPSKV